MGVGVQTIDKAGRMACFFHVFIFQAEKIHEF